ncbi:PQQ-dependent dehydrogenase, methanol/ethanol family [Candidatus Sumerlaeota bacterium]|nr:PQQ-dependent dehydrogenase, methanol/ethanol family [Candidatus Sumerlaeota bacterium]
MPSTPIRRFLARCALTATLCAPPFLFPLRAEEPKFADGVTAEALAGAQDHPEIWVNYSRNYQGWRYAPMDQINRQTVKRLVPKWTLQTGIIGGGFETTAVAFNNKLYVTTPNSHLLCVDARDGKILWRYDHILPSGVNICCGPVNRGVAILGKRVYYCTLDARLMCFDADTGIQLWDRAVMDYRDSYSLTLAPLIVKDKVIVGIAGAEYGIRGFIDAYNAATGERVWRFYTVPAKGEPGSETWKGDSWMNGGGPAWLTGTYDPALNLLYWGIGNPAPDFNGAAREGANLYTNSVVALNPDDGKLAWYFQMSPHDQFDWDGVSEPVLVDETINGAAVKAIVQANRNGYLYALDRTNGKFLYAKPYSNVNWATIDAEGKPVINPEILKGPQVHVCPGIFGGKNWPPTAYSPKTHLIYIPEMERCSTYSTMEVTFRKGLPYYGGYLLFDATAGGHVKALDTRTGEQKWSFDTGQPNWAGLLATGGGLVFGGAPDGYLRAFNDETGEVLWQYQTGNGVFAPPTSFTIDGKQVIGLASGWGQPAEGIGLGSNQKGCAYFLFGLLEN